MLLLKQGLFQIAKNSNYHSVYGYTTRETRARVLSQYFRMRKAAMKEDK